MGAEGIVAHSGRGAIALSYDGTKMCHLETAIPHLDRHGLKGTFYADGAPLVQHAPDWMKAAANGHEIANGTLLAAALPDGSLPAWTTRMILDDVQLADELLAELFPDQPETSFAFPIGVPRCADGYDYSHEILDHVNVGRSGVVGFNRWDSLDKRYVRCLPAYEMSGEELISYARTALAKGVLAVFAFDGVGCGELAIDARAHEDLCEWLADHRDQILVDTVVNVARAGLRVSASSFRLA